METIKIYALKIWEAIKAKPAVFGYGVVAGYILGKLL